MTPAHLIGLAASFLATASFLAVPPLACGPAGGGARRT